MNLYLVTQDVNNDFDTYDSIIVCASSEEEARTIVPDESTQAMYYKSSEDDYYGWAAPEYVQVTLIGLAEASVVRGVVLASYNAG